MIIPVHPSPHLIPIIPGLVIFLRDKQRASSPTLFVPNPDSSMGYQTQREKKLDKENAFCWPLMMLFTPTRIPTP